MLALLRACPVALALSFFSATAGAQNGARGEGGGDDEPRPSTVDPGGSAIAAPPPVASSPIAQSAPPRRRFYGWQSMLVEGVGGAALSAGILAVTYSDLDDKRDKDENELIANALAIGGLVYLSGCFVHGGHGHWTKALGSLGFTLGTPAVAALAGLAGAAAACEGAECWERTAAWSVVIGVMIAPLLDGLLLGWEDDAPDRRRGPARSSGGPALLPVPGGLAIGVAARM